MNKKIRAQLKKAFTAPAPIRKSKFLQSLNFPKTSRLDFILSQIGYIRKRIWIISSVLIFAAFIGIRFLVNEEDFNFIGIVSSVLPFLSLMTITEISRSTSYNMEELEMSCKNNFAGVVLTRLGILGFFNIFILSTLGIFIAVFYGGISVSIFRIELYLLIPFMLTCSLSLFIVNRLQSRETIYICGVIACFIAITNAIFTTQYTIVFSDNYMVYGIFAFVILAIFTIAEIIKFIKRTESLQWNLL